MTDVPKYFTIPFATGGDLTTIPDPTQGSGAVSYNQGFGPDYELASDALGYLTIPRAQFNQLMNDVTLAIQQLQQNGFPTHVTAALNDGSALAYSKNSYVRATDGNVYYSLINSNTDVPPTSNWQLSQIGSTINLYFNYAADTGTANTYIVAPNPPIVSYAEGDVIQLKPVHANTGASTVNANGLGAVPIVTLANVALGAGNLLPTGIYQLVYSAATSSFVIQNPSPLTAMVLPVLTVKRQVFVVSGTYTPSAGMIYCDAECLAAGGGAGCTSINNDSGTVLGTAGGSGAGAGAYSKKLFTAATITASQTVTIGAGGTGGSTSGVSGTDGGTSSLGALLSCAGGKGSAFLQADTITPVAGSQAGAGGAVPSLGDIVVGGNAGQNGFQLSEYSGISGAGASAIYGAGGASLVGIGGNPSQTGKNGTGYGSGGGGAIAYGSTGVHIAGGNGAGA